MRDPAEAFESIYNYYKFGYLIYPGINFTTFVTK